MARMWNYFRVSLDLSHVERSTMFLWMNSSWTWVLDHGHECWFSSNNEKVTGTKISSGIIFYWVSLSREIFTGTLCILERRLVKSKTFILFWKTNVLHLYFSSFELNNGSKIPKEKIEQHYISPFHITPLTLIYVIGLIWQLDHLK